jgi:small subunit ribosomal protein S21
MPKRAEETSLRDGKRNSSLAMPIEKGIPLQVFVRDNNVDQALRILKKKMQREGVFREMKRKRFYEKPSERATRERSEAVRRARKLARKKAQREGLIAARRRSKAASSRTGAIRHDGMRTAVVQAWPQGPHSQ